MGIARRPSFYELTDRVRKLGPIVLALGEWGVELPPPPLPASLSATSMMIYLRGAGRPDPDDPPVVCRLDLDGRPWTVRTVAGRVDVQAGEPGTADASLVQTRAPSTTSSPILTSSTPPSPTAAPPPSATSQPSANSSPSSDRPGAG